MPSKNPRGRPPTGAERRSISLPSEMWERIEAVAEGRPLSGELGRLVEDGLKFRLLDERTCKVVMDRTAKDK